MPELPEVETIKSAISKSIGHCNIKDIIVNNNKLRIPVPADIAEKARGARVTDCRRIAKYIIIELSSGYSLIWHMGMSGRVKIFSEQPEALQKHDHIIIVTEKSCLVYNDARRFGLLTYVKSDELKAHPLLAHLGPEPLEEAFNGAYLYSKLQGKKTAVKAALLDQEIVVGIGNIYASESLYHAGIRPQRPADKVSRRECEKIVECCRDVLNQAIAAGGSSIHDYQKPDGSLGYFQNKHCVYNKTGQKCPDCTCDVNKSGGIRNIKLAGRSSFYCPVRQK